MSTSASEVKPLTDMQDNFVRPTQYPVIPGDIVEQVCKEIFALSTIDQYDLSLMHGPQSPWCADLRFRKGLTLVSKVWWEPATRGLYEHVVIRRFGQIPALARTLSSRDAGIDFGALVRKITFLHECAFFWPCMDVVSEDLRFIIGRCVALQEFSFRIHPECANAISDEHKVQPLPDFGINPMWLFPQVIFPALQPCGSTTLRKLDVRSIDCWQKPVGTALLSLLASSPRITTLAIRNFDFPDADLLTLEFLEDLWVDFGFNPFVSVEDCSSRAIWKWELPRLRSLTLFHDGGLATMLEKHGRALTYLHVTSDFACFGEDFERLPQLCPVLEHFVVYPPYNLEGWACQLFRYATAPFRRLRHLDMWFKIGFKGVAGPVRWHPDAAAALLQRARAGFAPALESVRGLVWRSSMSASLHDDLARICHPAALAGAGDARLVCVRGVWMVQTGWCVRPVGDWWFEKGMWAEDDSGDYVGEDDEDEDRTSWVSDSNSDSDSDPEEGGFEESEQGATVDPAECNALLRRDADGCQSKGEQLSREEILDAFGRGQEGRDVLDRDRSKDEFDGDAGFELDVL